MSRKLRDIRRALSGYKEEPPELHEGWVVIQKGRSGPFTPEAERDRQVAFYRDFIQNYMPGQGAGSLASRLPGQEASAVQNMEDVRIGFDLAAVPDRDYGTVTGRVTQRDFVNLYRDFYRGPGRLSLLDSLQAELVREMTGQLTATQVAERQSRRDGFHLNDVSLVAIMAAAAQQEGWRLDSPRNLVPTGLSAEGLVEFRRQLATLLPPDARGLDCQFFGFGPTRGLVLTAQSELGDQDRATQWLVYSRIPYSGPAVARECVTNLDREALRARAFQLHDRLSASPRYRRDYFPSRMNW